MLYLYNKLSKVVKPKIFILYSYWIKNLLLLDLGAINNLNYLIILFKKRNWFIII